MKHFYLLFLVLCLARCGVVIGAAQTPPPSPCSDPLMPSGFTYTGSACASSTPFGQVTPVPLIDGSATTHYGNGIYQQIVSLYGTYGNSESSGMALTHYTQGTNLASQIVPLCGDGSVVGVNGCTANNAKIVFLFIGFSNCDVEICGGHVNAWDIQRTGHGTSPTFPQLAGQACATKCPNLGNPDGTHPWNRAFRGNTWDGYEQMSLLRLVYPDQNDTNTWLVDPSVVVFDGALGQQSLDKWDPTTLGYYANNDCPYDRTTSTDPECNYYRVGDDLRTNGYTEAQVQAIFIKAADDFPTCDVQQNFCSGTPDALLAEQHLGNILRYLKCCKTPPPGSQLAPAPRYLNLKQVFVTSRIYGGYANATNNGNTCLNPEPFAFELGFSVQRLIVDQINQVDDGWSGTVNYLPDSHGVNQGNAPWVDWGPYLWAYGETPRLFDGLKWCGIQNDFNCPNVPDVLSGDQTSPDLQAQFWGDFTHPSGAGVQKAANQLVNFIQNSPFVKPWAPKKP